MGLFDGFTLEEIALPAGRMRLRHGGSGPPLVCLHGNPQTHVMWHAVAPALADRFTVYCPDLRGYGVSPAPGYSDDHAAYSKRAMALDIAVLMDHYGHERFDVVAHDRGARAAHRLALDHPDRVERLAVMDIVPTLEHFERTDQAFAMAYAHWFYLTLPAPFPETLIGNDPYAWFQGHTQREPKVADLFHPQALNDYLWALSHPQVRLGICEDYRAAATIDLVHDRASREAGERIKCPLLALWGTKGIIGKMYEPLALWQSYCDAPVTGKGLDAGHYLAEEVPDDVVLQLFDFLIS